LANGLGLSAIHGSGVGRVSHSRGQRQPALSTRRLASATRSFAQVQRSCSLPASSQMRVWERFMDRKALHAVPHVDPGAGEGSLPSEGVASGFVGAVAGGGDAPGAGFSASVPSAELIWLAPDGPARTPSPATSSRSDCSSSRAMSSTLTLLSSGVFAGEAGAAPPQAHARAETRQTKMARCMPRSVADGGEVVSRSLSPGALSSAEQSRLLRA